MATVFCSRCGYIVARGDIDDPEQAVRDSGHSACPGCGSATGIGWSPADLSEGDLRAALGTATRSTQIEGGSLTPLADLIAMEMLRSRSRQTAGRWLLRAGLVMLVAGIAAGSLFWYLWADWSRTLLGGFLAAFTAAWIADRFLESFD